MVLTKEFIQNYDEIDGRSWDLKEAAEDYYTKQQCD